MVILKLAVSQLLEKTRTRKEGSQAVSAAVVTPIRVRNNTPKEALIKSRIINVENDGDGDGGGGEDGDGDSKTGEHMDKTGNINGPTTPRILASGTLFTAHWPDGANRDVIKIKCNKINDQIFKGTILYAVAKNIFTLALGLPEEQLYLINMSYNKCRIVAFKLKAKINIYDLRDKENFTMERKYKLENADVVDLIHCKIQGIWKQRSEPRLPNYDGSLSDIQWIEISGSQYSIDELGLARWLRCYGELLTPISEMAHKDSEVENGVGIGTYAVKMRLRSPIAQFLPAYGKKILVYYPGIKHLCYGCYGEHHRSKCGSPKLPLISYVKRFMGANAQIEKTMYGKI